MDISDHELRELVRSAIAKQAAAAGPTETESRGQAPQGVHPSHARLAISSGAVSSDGQCIIEPSVRCTHCGYCQSMGH